MKTGNVIDLLAYRNQLINKSTNPISEELQAAIQLLIHRLRELGPLSHPK